MIAATAAPTTTWRLLREHGLSLVVFTLFLITLLGQAVTGWRVYNADEQRHGQHPIRLIDYLGTSHFLEATAENWESEFLQMAAFVWLTSFLIQKGSPESKDPDQPDDGDDEPVTPESPWPARRGGWALRIYSYSLSITFMLMFLISFALHAVGGARHYSQERIEHGQSAVTVGRYLLSSQFWFESLQNWQSEFLSIGAMVVLAIFLRQKGSPESKPVAATHWRHE